MVIGALLILAQAAGMFLFAHRLGAFVNVTLSSNPGLISSTNTIVLCTNIAGAIGWLLLLASVVFRILSARSQGTGTHSSDPPDYDRRIPARADFPYSNPASSRIDIPSPFILTNRP